MKSIANLRQETMIFRDFFHKKTEQFNCRKLELYFEEFLINKLAECSQILSEIENSTLLAEVNELR